MAESGQAAGRREVRYDESRPLGRNFRDPAEVEAYDAFHRRFRDAEAENAALLAEMGLTGTETAGDFGCGTGRLVRAMARKCREVWAIDLSEGMLEWGRKKAEEEGVQNIQFRQGTFLGYVHDGPLLDVLNCSLALHHLPDFWKGEALKRMAGMLKAGGRGFWGGGFFFPGGGCFGSWVCFVWGWGGGKIDRWMRQLEERGGRELAEELSRHVEKEFSTVEWILLALLERAGFRVEEARSGRYEAFRTYRCVKA